MTDEERLDVRQETGQPLTEYPAAVGIDISIELATEHCFCQSWAMASVFNLILLETLCSVSTLAGMSMIFLATAQRSAATRRNAAHSQA